MIVPPSQIGVLLFTIGVSGEGFTVIVKLIADPAHPLAFGVTVIVDVTTVVPEFVTVKEPIFPVPFEAKPIDELLFVQSKDVPATVPLNITSNVLAPLHNT